MTPKEQLESIAKRLRGTASTYRQAADAHDRNACAVEFMKSATDESAEVALKFLLQNVPEWFAN